MSNENLVNNHLDGTSFLFEGGAIGVLLLHGLTATTTEVRLLAENLHEHGFTVVGPLLSGHGTTPDDLNQVKWEDWAWEAEKSLQYLLTICDSVFVGGESMGGALALYMATRFPQIAGVICYAPAIKLNMSYLKEAQLHAAAPFMDSIPKDMTDNNSFWQGYAVNPLKAVAELVEMGRFVRRNLEKITQPILVIQGRHDETVAEDVGEIILNGVASSIKQLLWMENSAHIILLEAEREQIFELTRTFLQVVLEK